MEIADYSSNSPLAYSLFVKLLMANCKYKSIDENFPISGLRPRQVFIRSIAIIKRAAAEVNSGAQLVKVTLATQRSVRETALEKAAAGELKHRDENRLVSID